MALSALHVTFLWEACQPSERMIQQFTELETEISLAVDDADLFNSEVGDDILNAMNMYEVTPLSDGTMTKARTENAIAFCNALAEVYLTVPIERQPTFTDTLFKTGVTEAILAIMRATPPALKAEDSVLFSAQQMSCATVLVAMAIKRSENDVTRTEYAHQRLCRQLVPVLQHMVYSSPCLATVLVLLRYLLIIGSTHKPFFMDILDEFHGVVDEFLKPGVLTAHWNNRIPAKQLKLLKSLTPYMPGEVNCFVNILSWLVFEIPLRGMTEMDMDKIMEKENLLNTYWRILNEPVPSTYFRFAKSKVLMFYSSLCGEGPQYSNKLIEKYGICTFLDRTVQLADTKIDQRSIFPLSCLMRNLIICLNPLHPDNIFPMDKAMELIYEEYGKNDDLIQTEVLSYIPGMKKATQVKVADMLKDFAGELRYAFLSDFMIKNERRKVKKTKSFKAVRFSGSDQIEDINDLRPEAQEQEPVKPCKDSRKSPKDSRKSPKILRKSENGKKSRDQKDELTRAESEAEGILTTSYDTLHADLKGYLENRYGPDYHMYLSIFANNGLYMSNKRKLYYNCLEETDREMLAAICTVCSKALNKMQCVTCGLKYCTPECVQEDALEHSGYCSLKSLEKSLHEAVVS